MAEVLEEHDRNLPKMPKSYQRMVRAAREAAKEDPDSIKPVGMWAGGFNGPVAPEEIRAVLDANTVDIVILERGKLAATLPGLRVVSLDSDPPPVKTISSVPH